MTMLPVEVVFHPSWWHKHENIIFDEDFFFHPKKRVESELAMENALYSRFGKYGLGKFREIPRPVIGPVHLAAGYFLSEVSGCQVDYLPGASPLVHPQNGELVPLTVEQITSHRRWKQLTELTEALKIAYGYVVGDLDWGGVLNMALDMRGNDIFYDFYDDPVAVTHYFDSIATTIDYFTDYIYALTGSTSISVNRSIINRNREIFLHSECAHTMISGEQYEEFLLKYDLAWSKKWPAFGIHYCGGDPDRFAQEFAKIPTLEFLDVGWGGDVATLRKHLPNTFLNLRLDPTEIGSWSEGEMNAILRDLINAAENPQLTGICCINMDFEVSDEAVLMLLEQVTQIREEYHQG